jgi:hypothetical protein
MILAHTVLRTYQYATLAAWDGLALCVGGPQIEKRQAQSGPDGQRQDKAGRQETTAGEPFWLQAQRAMSHLYCLLFAGERETDLVPADLNLLSKASRSEVRTQPITALVVHTEKTPSHTSRSMNPRSEVSQSTIDQVRKACVIQCGQNLLTTVRYRN